MCSLLENTLYYIRKCSAERFIIMIKCFARGNNNRLSALSTVLLYNQIRQYVTSLTDETFHISPADYCIYRSLKFCIDLFFLMASIFPLAIPLPPIYCMNYYVRGTESKVDTTGNDWLQIIFFMMILKDNLYWWSIVEEGGGLTPQSHS